MRELPPRQRIALCLREMEGISYEQACERMDATLPGVKSLIHRAREGLHEGRRLRVAA